MGSSSARRRAGLRPWQWLVLGCLAAADSLLVVLSLPVLLSAIAPARGVALAAPQASPTAAIALQATPTPAPRASPAAGQPPQPRAGQARGGDGLPVQAFAPAAGNVPELQASPTPAPTLPPEALIDGLRGRTQSLPLSCESRSAADWAAYFGVAIDELEFFAGLPVSDNPEFGFVGDVRGAWGKLPPHSYGVHAGPVAARLRQYGLNAYSHRGLSWEALRRQIALGQPVIVWVTGHVEPGTPESYQSSDGLTTTVARFEHTVIVVGYSEKSVMVMDGKSRYYRPLDVFLDSWAVLGNLAVVRGLLPGP